MQSKPLIRIWLSVLSFIIISIAAGAYDQVPKHLEIGRALLSSLSDKDTSYRYHSLVKWKGDPSTTRTEAHTDCSGLASSLLKRASCSQILHQHIKNPRSTYPLAEDYFSYISKQEGFKRINSIADIRPGDIIAIKYIVGNSAKDTGHVMLIDAIPAHRKGGTKPIIKGTRQWDVAVIDSATSPHGKTDTRYGKNGQKRNGVGRGVIRLYSREDGEVVGYTWSTLRNSVYYDKSSRPLAIGRVLCYSDKVVAGTAVTAAVHGR